MATDMTVAKQIMYQMGGLGRLKSMIGATNFGGTEDSLQFTFKGSREHNRCRVTLDEGNDTYTLALFKYRPSKYDCPMTYEVEGLHFDQLQETFIEQTGLYLSLGTMGR